MKEKRSVVKKLLGRVRSRFNVAAAEIGNLDQRDRAGLGFAAVGNDRDLVRKVLDEVVNFVDAQYLAEIVEEDLEVENYG